MFLSSLKSIYNNRYYTQPVAAKTKEDRNKQNIWTDFIVSKDRMNVHIPAGLTTSLKFVIAAWKGVLWDSELDEILFRRTSLFYFDFFLNVHV